MPRRRFAGAVPLLTSALVPATVPLTPRPRRQSSRRREDSTPSADAQLLEQITFAPPLDLPRAVTGSTLAEAEREARRSAWRQDRTTWRF